MVLLIEEGLGLGGRISGQFKSASTKISKPPRSGLVQRQVHRAGATNLDAFNDTGCAGSGATQVRRGYRIRARRTTSSR